MPLRRVLHVQVPSYQVSPSPGVMTYDPATHVMQYWDSHFNAQTRAANTEGVYTAFAELLFIYRNRLVRLDLRGPNASPPTRGPYESDIQRNGFDYGIFAVENARRFVEETGNYPTNRTPITTNLRSRRTRLSPPTARDSAARTSHEAAIDENRPSSSDAFTATLSLGRRN
ncbi:hypothetical protein AYO21_12133 [Fonsecaea monophora]|uniref:Uncharacterized protein n=1 Tax=Fonsecaea monophora TaxID=254056 RepID=A0A177EQQ3_9EURO|nr:hypothetical protein AYO21_12133 [Fonsecaea monophora]OAG33781.1 hypothetical protein AYO21_12133 [Fonsecaea monophora]